MGTDLNIWFYTFSTAAQVMAALAGLLAVFVVYKIEDSSDDLTSLRNTVRNQVHDISQNTDKYESIHFDATVSMPDQLLLKHFSALLKILEVDPNDEKFARDPKVVRRYYTQFLHLVTTKRRILTDLKQILAMSFSAIALSLTALVFTEFLIQANAFAVLVSSLIFFSFCLYIIGNRIYRIAAT